MGEEDVMDNYEYYLARAIISLALDDAKTAVSDCSKVIQDNQDNDDALDNAFLDEPVLCIRGIGYCELGEYDKAQADFTEIIQSLGKYQTLPPPFYAVFNRGVARMRQGKLALAKNDFLAFYASSAGDWGQVGTDGEMEIGSTWDIIYRESFTRGELDSDSLVYLGQCYSKTNDIKEAIRCYSRAIEILTPDGDKERASDKTFFSQRLPSSHPYSQHGYRLPLAWGSSESVDLTIRLLGHSIEAEDPNDISSDSDIHFAERTPYFYLDYIRHLRGECRYRQEEYGDAVRDLSPYLETLPETQSKGAYYYMRSRAYRKIGMLEECMTDSERMIDVDPDNKWSYYNLAMALSTSTLGKYDEAKLVCTKALDIDPNDDFFLYLRGYCLIQTGDKTRGLEDLSAAIEINPKHSNAKRLLKDHVD